MSVVWWTSRSSVHHPLARQHDGQERVDQGSDACLTEDATLGQPLAERFELVWRQALDDGGQDRAPGVLAASSGVVGVDLTRLAGARAVRRGQPLGSGGGASAR